MTCVLETVMPKYDIGCQIYHMTCWVSENTIFSKYKGKHVKSCIWRLYTYLLIVKAIKHTGRKNI